MADVSETERVELRDGGERFEHEDCIIGNEAGLGNLMNACAVALQDGEYHGSGSGSGSVSGESTLLGSTIRKVRRFGAGQTQRSARSSSLSLFLRWLELILLWLV